MSTPIHAPAPDLLVPYYEHPADRPAAWQALLAAAPRLYGVVLNPASGPGTGPDPAFAEAAARLRAAGVRVLGYADTGYAMRPVAEVAADLARHRDWYGVDGAFLDQVSAGPHAQAHYRGVAAAAWRAGCGTLVFNHGTDPHPSYARIADVLVTFEGTWATYRDLPAQPRHDGVLTCHLVHGVPPGADCAALARARGAGLHCAVPGSGHHPWGTLPHALETAR